MVCVMDAGPPSRWRAPRSLGERNDTMFENLRGQPLRYQVAQLADAEIVRLAQAAQVDLDGQREAAALMALAGLMDGETPEESEGVLERLARQAKDAILIRAREPGHGDMVLHLLLSHRFRRRLEPSLPEHTVDSLLAWARLSRHRRVRPQWGSRKLT
jgi:hypothetical protein